jgi:GWxTD domain-containing protein
MREFICVAVTALLIWGAVSCGGGRKIALDPESQNFYEYAYLIMTGVEKDIFRHLPDKEARAEFIKDFWAKRDPDPDTEENEYKAEFYRRIEYANERFREGPPGWKTDRGRIYIYLGPPDRFDEIFTHREVTSSGEPVRGSVILWYYYRYGVAIKFEDVKNNGKYTFDPMDGLAGSLTEAIEMAKLGISIGEGRMSQKYLNFDLKYDAQKKEIIVYFPVEGINFLEEGGLLKADFEFEFHINAKTGAWNDKFTESRSFADSEDNLLETKEIVFVFSYDLEPGKYYFDVIIRGDESIGKTRKIFDIKIGMP